MVKISEGDVFGFWKVLKPDSGERRNTDILSECLCTICNNTQLIRATELRCGNILGCKSCRQIYINSFIGKKYNMLTILSYSHRSSRSREIYNCICDCGKEGTIALDRLPYTKSCGCLRFTATKTHGMSKTKIYGVHSGMKGRCYNENEPAYHYYGGKGVYICDEWLGEDGFINFYNWSMENSYSEELTIDRIDGSGPYAPWNCRWVDMEVQNNNKCNINKYLVENELLSSAQLSRKYEIDRKRIKSLLKQGKSIYTVLNDDFKLEVSKNSIISFVE